MDVHAKPTNNFTYILPNTCHPRKSINKIPHAISLSEEYNNYLIAKDYHPGSVDKQFQKVYKNLLELIRKYIHYLLSDEVLKKAFPNNTFSVIYKRNRNLKEIVALSLYPKPSIKNNGTIVSCNKCDICKNFLIADIKFR